MDRKYVKAWKYQGESKVSICISDTGKKEDEKLIAKNIEEKKALAVVKKYMKKGYASYEKMREEVYDEEVAVGMIRDMLNLKK